MYVSLQKMCNEDLCVAIMRSVFQSSYSGNMNSFGNREAVVGRVLCRSGGIIKGKIIFRSG